MTNVTSSVYPPPMYEPQPSCVEEKGLSAHSLYYNQSVDLFPPQKKMFKVQMY